MRFFFVGAAKSGTTTLFEWLRQHPAIFLPAVKEPRYFACGEQRPDFRGPMDDRDANRISVWKWADYCELFAAARPDQWCADMSMGYFCNPASAERIAQRFPAARILVILRHPAERAFSNYLMLRGQARETLSFEAALAAEDERRRQGWSPTWLYRERGEYARQLKPYLEAFPGRVKVWLYEDLARPQALLREICEFLEIDSSLPIDVSHKAKVSVVPRWPALQKFLQGPHWIKRLYAWIPKSWLLWINRWLRSRNAAPRPVLLASTRAALIESYRADILELQELIGRDLSHWL